jgi:hypothetical protein
MLITNLLLSSKTPTTMANGRFLAPLVPVLLVDQLIIPIDLTLMIEVTGEWVLGRKHRPR